MTIFFRSFQVNVLVTGILARLAGFPDRTQHTYFLDASFADSLPPDTPVLLRSLEKLSKVGISARMRCIVDTPVVLSARMRCIVDAPVVLSARMRCIVDTSVVLMDPGDVVHGVSFNLLLVISDGWMVYMNP